MNNEKVKNPYELNEPPKPEWLDQAITKYLSKLDFVVLEKKLSDKKQQMDFKHAIQTYSFDYVFRKVFPVLDKHGILPEFRAEYIAYSLELFRVWRKFRPQIWKWRTDWIRELKIIAQKWKNRQLNINVLKDIAIVLNCEDIIQFL